MSQKLRLSQVPEGSTFEYQGQILTHDLIGRSGGGQVAVRTKEGKPLKLQHSVVVTIVDEESGPLDLETPVENQTFVSPPPVDVEVEVTETEDEGTVEVQVDEFPLDVLPPDESEDGEEEVG